MERLVLDWTIDILDYCRKKNLPVFTLQYVIYARNEDIENYIAETKQTCDYEGGPLSKKTIKKLFDKRIEDFHKEPNYDMSPGWSEITLSRCCTISDINYNFVKDTMYQIPIRNSSHFIRFILDEE